MVIAMVIGDIDEDDDDNTAGLNEVRAVRPSQPGCTKAQTNQRHLCHLWITSEGEIGRNQEW